MSETFGSLSGRVVAPVRPPAAPRGWPLPPIPSATRTSVRVMEAAWLASQLEAGRSIESIAREAGRSAVDRRLLGQQARPDVPARGAPPRARRPRRASSSSRWCRRAARSARSPAQLGVSPHGPALAQEARAAARGRGATRSRGEPKPATLVRGMRRSTAGRRTSASEAPATAADAATSSPSPRVGERSRRSWSAKRAVLPASAASPSTSARSTSTTSIRPRRRSPSSRDGVTRSLRRAREEAGKCVLLCANCHAMVEAGSARSRRTCRSCRGSTTGIAVGGSSMAEHSAVNRRVVGSSPTPRVRGPLPPLAASEQALAISVRSAPVSEAGSAPPRPRRPARLRSRWAAGRPARARSRAPCG